MTNGELPPFNEAGRPLTSAILATENSVLLKLAANAKLLVDRPPSASSSGSRDIHAQNRTRPSFNSIFLIC